MSYDWIKDGVDYRVVGCVCGHQFNIGSIVKWTGDDNLFTDGVSEWYMEQEELEEVVMNKLEVGKKYTGHNGYEWMCIASDGEYAFMVMDGGGTPAYRWTLMGVSRDLGDDYNVKFEPVVEWVEHDLNYDKSVHASFYDGHDREGVNLRIRFPLIDGTPDWSQAKVTPA